MSHEIVDERRRKATQGLIDIFGLREGAELTVTARSLGN
jgi:hypothetical protein